MNRNCHLPLCRSRRFLAALCSLFIAHGLLSSPTTLDEARFLIENKRLPEARQPLEALIAAEPNNLPAHLLLARCYNGMQRFDDTITLLGPVINAASDTDKAAHPLLAEYAEACLLKADTLGTGFRALSLARRGRDALEKASALAPGNIDYHEGLVEFYRHAPRIAGGSHSKALAHAQATTRLNPLRGGLLEAAIQADDKNFTSAFALCDATLAIAPDSYLALYTLGRIAAESGQRITEGKTALLRCLSLPPPSSSEPPHAAVYYRLGLIAEKQAQRDEARAHFETSLRLAPNYQQAKDALRRVR